MSIQPGRYIITNAKHANLASLSNDNDGDSLRAHYMQQISGEEWQVYSHGNGRYSIQNYGHKTWARTVTRSAEKEHVTAERVRDHGRPSSLWFIEKSPNDKNYTISTPKPEMIWWLDDEDQGTPITLHSPQLHDAHGQWTFSRIYLEDEIPGDKGESGLNKEQAGATIKAVQDKAEREIRAVEERAQQAIRAAEERAQRAEAIAREETTRRQLAEKQAEEAIRATEEREEKTIRMAEEWIGEVRRMSRDERAKREAAESLARKNARIANGVSLFPNGQGLTFLGLSGDGKVWPISLPERYW